MRTALVSGLLVFALAGLFPATSSACCVSQSARMVWPMDGMKDVPVDASVILFGLRQDGDSSRPEWVLQLSPEDGGPVDASIRETDFPGGWFFVVVRPSDPLTPLTTYTLKFQQGDSGAAPVDVSFVTEACACNPAPLPPLQVDYLGIATLNWTDQDGGKCISSVTVGEGTLAVKLAAQGLENRLLVVEVRDDAGATVFKTFFSGKTVFSGLKLLAGGLCDATFDVDPCQHYCVRAALLDNRGDPGPWSDWSCSEEIGYWECGDPEGNVYFGEDIPPDLVQGEPVCNGDEPAGEADATEDTSSPGGNTAFITTGLKEGPPAGCTHGSVPARGLPVLLLLPLGLWILRLSRPSAAPIVQ